MSTATSREAELVELAREFITRADDLEHDLAEAVDWTLGDDFRGKLRRIVAEHDYQKGAPRWASPVDLAEALVDEVGAELGVDTGSLSEPHFKRAVDAAAALLS